MHLMHNRAELLTHIQTTNSQDDLPDTRLLSARGPSFLVGEVQPFSDTAAETPSGVVQRMNRHNLTFNHLGFDEEKLVSFVNRNAKAAIEELYRSIDIIATYSDLARRGLTYFVHREISRVFR